MTKMKIALAAVLLAATSSAAFAQFDPDLSNRYPGYAQPNTYGYSGSGKLGGLDSATVNAHQSAQVGPHKHGNALLQSAPVGLRQRDVSLPGSSEDYYDGVRQFDADRFDHASSPYAGN